MSPILLLPATSLVPLYREARTNVTFTPAQPCAHDFELIYLLQPHLEHGMPKTLENVIRRRHKATWASQIKSLLSRDKNYHYNLAKAQNTRQRKSSESVKTL